MSESKMLKAKCTKTGKYFGLEIKEFGSTWKVVNMIELNDEEKNIIMSEVRQPSFETHTTLLPCRKCGSHRVGGCSCSRTMHSCSPDMEYHFDCVYCDSLKIDYSRSLSRSPYTKWAGTSNIPAAIKDRYGNPQGSEYDLAEDGSFEGYKIVVLNLCDECDFKNPAIALKKKGFTIEEYKHLPSLSTLETALYGDNTQLWVISHRKGFMNGRYINLIEDYFNEGHGVYIWGDNDPYYVDANHLLEKIFGTSMVGNYYADQVLGIQKKNGERGIVANHPITTGIVNFYEGITIARINMTRDLEPLIYSSDRNIVTAYYDKNGKRALVDGGFTRLYYKWDSAGTDRYVVNAACWLTNIERFGYFN